MKPERAVAPAISVGVVILVILAGWHVELFRVALGMVTPYLPLLLYGGLVVAIVLSRKLGPPGARLVWQGLAASVVLHLVPVFGGWERGQMTSTIAGVVPIADGTLYVGGAERFLFDGAIDDYNSRRPLYALFGAARLGLTGLDLRLSLILQAVLVGAACFLAARVVARDLGPLAGLGLFVGLFGFSSYGVGSAVTEPLGVAFGALALAALWTAVRTRDGMLMAAGLFLLMVGLNVRSSTPLVPIALAFWFAYHLRQRRRFLNLRTLVVALLAVTLGFMTNYAAIAVARGDSANLGGNAPYLIYGMSQGLPAWSEDYGSWGAAYADFPEELAARDEVERNNLVASRAREEIREHPGRFAGAVVRSAGNYVRLAADLAAGPIRHSWLRRMSVVAAGLLALGLVLRRRQPLRDRATDIALLATLFLSVPVLSELVVELGSRAVAWWCGASVFALGLIAFGARGSARVRLGAHLAFFLVAFAALAAPIPVLGIDRVRVFAATAPFFALSVALAAAILGRRVTPDEAALPRPVSWTPAIVGIVLLAGILVGAPVAGALIDKPAIERPVCPDGRKALALLGGVAVEIIPDGGGARNHLDQVVASAIAPSRVPLIPDVMAQIPTTPPFTIVTGITPAGDDRISFIQGRVSAAEGAVRYLCTRPLGDLASQNWSALAWPRPVDFAFVFGTPFEP